MRNGLATFLPPPLPPRRTKVVPGGLRAWPAKVDASADAVLQWHLAGEEDLRMLAGSVKEELASAGGSASSLPHRYMVHGLGSVERKQELVLVHLHVGSRVCACVCVIER
jgi:hypothetical protein